MFETDYLFTRDWSLLFCIDIQFCFNLMNNMLILLVFQFSIINILSATHLRYSGSIGVCSTPACLESSANIIGAMHDSFEACSDMWSFACEGWVAKNRLPESRSK